MSEVGGHDRSAGAVCSGDEAEDKETLARARSGSKPHSTPQTLKWLEENYEIAEGVCIPRSTLYYHYLDFCEANDTQPVNAASFGKIIRQQFPQITTRRLGTRGQSKYHYYGIGVKESSTYYDVIYSSKGVQSAGEGKKEPPKQLVAYSPRSKLGTLLPEFPDIKDIKVPPGVEEAKVLTFLMMYRTHCQRILDTVIRANFDEVQNFLLHFWQGMPPHIIPILSSPTIVMLVGVCDSILYRAISSVLMPTVLQALPDSLTQVIRRFAKQLDEWLKNALSSLPEGLQNMKFDLARRFAQVLRRQTSLNHLCQAARSVLQSAEITGQLLEDWLSVDLNSIVKQTLYTMDQYSYRDHTLISNLCGEFEHMLEEQAPIESIIEWLDKMVDKCVVKPSSKKTRSLRQIARQFLLMWSCFGTRVIRDMTLHSAPSFGSFHLLHLMFDDYVLYRIEALHSQERVAEFLRVIRGEEIQECEEQILPDPQALKDNLQPLLSLTPHCSLQQQHHHHHHHQQQQQQQQQHHQHHQGQSQHPPPPASLFQDRGTVIATNSSVLHDLQDYDSQQEGYSTDESGSLEQVPSPRGAGLDLTPPSSLPISAPPPTHHGAGMSGYSNGYPAHYAGHYGKPQAMAATTSHTPPSHTYTPLPASSTMLPQGLDSQGREPLITPSGNLRMTGSEWNVSQQPRQQQGMMGDPNAGLRGNEAMTYNYNPALRHHHPAYDAASAANSFQYDVTNSGGGGMVYPGFSGDVFMTSGQQQGGDVSKRRYEDDQQYMRSCKRANKEAFYFQPTFTNIG
ncbi:regulatory factor X 4-like isoform X2 [Babylonia areolata]|uniref:regulatory factor X 4-like isoform X2 n=1 Tax=Babylonia areolata TaxID=304850 RepID=UPI003FD1BC6C